MRFDRVATRALMLSIAAGPMLADIAGSAEETEIAPSAASPANATLPAKLEQMERRVRRLEAHTRRGRR